MKNIKLRIMYLILCSALLLFALFMLAVNLIIPAHFVREAKRRSSARHSTRTAPSPIPTTNPFLTMNGMTLRNTSLRQASYF